MTAHCPIAQPRRHVVSRSTPTFVTLGAISLRSCSHFPARLYSNCVKPVILPPGRARLATKPAPTGSIDCASTIGTVRLARCTASPAPPPATIIDVRRERDQFLGPLAKALAIERTPAMIKPQVAADSPAQLLQSLLERRHVKLRFLIVGRQVHQRADAPHALALLRARRQRPRRRRTAENRR